MLPLESEKPRYTPRQDADRELPILVPSLYRKTREKANGYFLRKAEEEIKRLMFSASLFQTCFL